MDDSLFSIFPPKFEKVVKWGSGSFEFYLLVRVISSWMPFDPGPFMGCYSVTSAERTFLMNWCAKRLDRGETLKHPFQADAAASSWLNQSRMIEKARQDLETNFRSSDKSKWTIEAKLTWVTWGTRGERDVIRLRNPTEDKGAFRRTLLRFAQTCEL